MVMTRSFWRSHWRGHFLRTFSICGVHFLPMTHLSPSTKSRYRIIWWAKSLKAQLSRVSTSSSASGSGSLSIWSCMNSSRNGHFLRIRMTESYQITSTPWKFQISMSSSPTNYKSGTLDLIFLMTKPFKDAIRQRRKWFKIKAGMGCMRLIHPTLACKSWGNLASSRIKSPFEKKKFPAFNWGIRAKWWTTSLATRFTVHSSTKCISIIRTTVTK